MEQGQENCEVISECVAFTIGCVSLPSHGWIFHGYPTLIFLGFLHECSGRHHLSEFLPLSAQPNTSTPPSQTSSGICLFTHPRPSPADTGSARPSGMSFPRQLVPADRKKVSGNMNTTPGVRPALSGGCGELKLSVGSPARHTLPGTPCPGPAPLTSHLPAKSSRLLPLLPPELARAAPPTVPRAGDSVRGSHQCRGASGCLQGATRQAGMLFP